MKDSAYETLARLGFVARGVVYLLVGGLAVVAALGPGGATTGSKGALASLLGQPFGWALLGAIAFGLLCFAAWRFAQSVLNADRLGDSWRERLRRIGVGVSALVNAALAVSALGLLIGARGSSDGQGARDWTAWLLSIPFGKWIVGLFGAAIAIAAIGVAHRGWKADFEDRLDGGEAVHAWIRPLGRTGFFARALVLLIIGGFLTAAAWGADPGDARGLAGALRTLQAQPYGWILLAATALGLFLFGLLQFVIAWYRRIEVPDSISGGGHISKAVHNRFARRVGKRSLPKLMP